MKYDVEALLLPENYDELQELEFKSKFEWIEMPTKPQPIKRYTVDQIKQLEEQMKKEGKL